MTGVGDIMDGNTSIEIEVVRPPFQIIVFAAVVVLVAAVLLPLQSLVAHGLGYLLSSVVCFLLTAGFIQADRRRASRRGVDYRPWGASRQFCTGVLVVGFAVACWHAWYIASELAVA